MTGEPIQGAGSAIRLFATCQHMQWAHLPNAGGLYDQDPDLLDKFYYIFTKIDEHEAAEQAKQKKEAEQAQRRTRGGPTSSRLRRGRR